MRRWLCGVVVVAACAAAAEPALDHISAQSLRGHVSFLASDLLEGRNTPSRGLDLAAEYIASQFRRAGLEPAGDDGYFQTAAMLQLTPEPAEFEMKFQQGENVLTIPRDQAVPRVAHAVTLTGTQIFRMGGTDAAALDRGQVRGRAVVTDAARGARRTISALQKLEPAVIIRLVRGLAPVPPAQLVEAAERASGAPVILISDEQAVRTLGDLKPGLSDWKVSLRIAAERETPVKARNVIGVLRGSDAALKDTYVLLTAHYDHIGLAKSGDDRVYNGANDNASGVASMIEIAAALTAQPVHPKRSIVFMAFFGEEEGLLGSHYYAGHPVFPLEKTVADINLEQLGRTDDSGGPQIGTATFTGFEYSDVPATFQKAGASTGVKVYELSNGGNEYFNRSDNISFADHGIPAHTVVVAPEFPDYHAVGDEWPKLDYDNMAKIDRMLALGLLMVADNPQAPKWNGAKAGRYAGRR